MKYTVIVKRPDYVTDDPTDTYCAWVVADTPEEAARMAQKEVCAVDEYDVDFAVDWLVLYVFAGHLTPELNALDLVE